MSDLSRGPNPALRHVQAFLSVVESGSFTEAGERLNRSVSAVSRSVSLLENMFGRSLLKRGTVQQTPTVEGVAVARRAAAIRHELTKCRDNALRYHHANVPGNSALFGMVTDCAHLRALVAVRDFRSVQRAASLLGVSQPTVSYSIRLLESEVGGTLFSRLPSGMIATPLGEHVSVSCRRILAELARMHDDIRSADGTSSGLVCVGALAYSRSAVLPKAIQEILRIHPGISVRTVEGHIDQLIASLHGGEIDIVLCARPDQALLDGLKVEPFAQDQMGLFVRKDHPLASQTRIQPEILQENDFILPPVGTITRKLLEDFFHTQGLLPPRGRVETSSNSLVRALLTGSDLIAFRTLREFETDQVNLVVSLDMSVSLPKREICILSRAAGQATAAVEIFIGTVRSI